NHEQQLESDGEEPKGRADEYSDNGENEQEYDDDDDNDEEHTDGEDSEDDGALGPEDGESPMDDDELELARVGFAPMPTACRALSLTTTLSSDSYYAYYFMLVYIGSV
ncbi:hypothetical protein BD310DRAFT_909470, partial [Dichomitus squalens]